MPGEHLDVHDLEGQKGRRVKHAMQNNCLIHMQSKNTHMSNPEVAKDIYDT